MRASEFNGKVGDRVRVTYETTVAALDPGTDLPIQGGLGPWVPEDADIEVLPTPIKAGDYVLRTDVSGGNLYEVRALEGDFAWIRLSGGTQLYTVRVLSLRVATGAVAS